MKKTLLTCIYIILFVSCATKKIQIDSSFKEVLDTNKEIQHSFYLIGDSGEEENVLKQFKQKINSNSDKTTTIFLGNNAYSNKQLIKRKALFSNQLKSLEGYKGKAVFIPGSYEWDNGLKSMKKHQNEVEKLLGKHAFSPKNGCPITDIKINDDIVVIVIDSEWYFENWDKHPTVNKDCEIKNRNDLFDAFEGLIKKNIGKTTLVAIHRPMFSDGIYGGKSTFAQQLYPLPILGHAIRKTSGVFSSDLQNKRYLEFRHRMVTLAQHNPKVVFVSGHEQSLQYLKENNIAQIISGSGGVKTMATKNNKALFTYGAKGFSKLDVYKDGSSVVNFYSIEEGEVKKVFSHEVFKEDPLYKSNQYPANFPKTHTSQIYSDEEVASNKVKNFFWGERYRKYYGTKVTAPVVELDTLFGGLTPVRKGGGHQSKSLRLKTASGKQYVMRALRKSGTKYLQAIAFKDQYIEGVYEKTALEKLILDVFTGSHPYAPFVIGRLSDAVEVFHTNPVMYYVPKQNSLGKFNDSFGDELYMIEEHTSAGHGDLKSFGNAEKIISTDDMYKSLRKNTKHCVDQNAYIKARLFDMLIGDWDRHDDQWRWAEFIGDNGHKYYKPIPRDRDQAFSIMSDGFFLGASTVISPDIRLLKSYSEDLKSPKWFNAEPFPLDVTLTARSSEDVWLAQAQFIQENLSDKDIDEAFALFPKEVNDETVAAIKEKLKGRRKNLKEIAKKYYKHISKYAIVTGTDKDDSFELERKPNGITTIKAYHSKDGKRADLIFEKEYSRKSTREIWIYGLDGKDKFSVVGKGDKCIPLRIVGGQGKDSYLIDNGKKVAFYDFKSKNNDFKNKKGIIKLKDKYDTNIYDHSKIENNRNNIIPLLGFNPDDGFKIGLSDTFIINGFERNPYTQKHKISGAYYFATKGYEAAYTGEIANLLGDFNLGLEASFQSPNYAINFFGFGNGTSNPEPDSDNLDLDFNRVKIEQIKISPSLIYNGKLGSKFKLGVSYEVVEAEETEGRFVEATDELTRSSFDEKSFIGTQASYRFENKNNNAFPTLGIETELIAGYKVNVDESDTSFGYLIPSLSFDYKLTTKGSLVLATKLKGHINLGDDFEFYQGATIGGNDGLRGFRNQRFTGKESFYQNTDLRWNFKEISTHVIPLKIGVYSSFDYGRVWSDFDVSEEWNTSYGGGIWFNGADLFTAQFGLFNSDEESRFTFGLGFGF